MNPEEEVEQLAYDTGIHGFPKRAVVKLMKDYHKDNVKALKEFVEKKIVEAEDGIKSMPHDGKIKFACAWTKQELEDIRNFIDKL